MICRLIATRCSMGALIDTAYVGRSNATFRCRLVPLVRRSRAGVHKHSTLESGMWLVGGCYNFLRSHRSLTASVLWLKQRGLRTTALEYGGVVEPSRAACGATDVVWAKAGVAAGG